MDLRAKTRLPWAGILAILCLCAPAPWARPDDDEIDLTALSLEDLLGVKVTVTSASKKPQDLRKTPAAIYVLSQEEIRRSGVTSVAEALRLVPGMHVVRNNSHSWGIGPRGFNSGFSNKVLVLVDGRAVYDLLQAGVYWDVQDMILEDIDRIEVIRGPGGAIWGANAMNGVINIITKKAQDTQGSLATLEFGTEDHHIWQARQGGAFEGGGYWRVYAKSMRRDSMEFGGVEDLDEWNMRRAGFRADWDENDEGDTFTVQGDVYDGTVHGYNFRATPMGNIPLDLSTRVGGFNVLGRWTREVSDENTIQVQSYFARTEREDPLLGEDNNTFDIEFSQHLSGDDLHDWVWGANYRVSQSNYQNSDQFVLEPDPRTKGIVSFFVQDEMTVVDDTFYVTLGSKFENNSFTDWAVQPTARAAWTPTSTETVWAAVSKAVRTPSTIERDGYIASFGLPGFNPGDPDTLFAYVPGPDFDNEELIAYEIGFRSQVTDDFSVDVAAYYNEYDSLGTEELGADIPIDATSVLAPFVAENKGSGIGKGVEVSAEWIASESWELEGSYTYLDLALDIDDDSTDFFFPSIDNNPPQDIFHLRSHHELSDMWELDWLLFYTSALKGQGIDSAYRGDVRVGWHPDEATEIAFGLRNLLHEGDAESAGGNEIEPEGYVRGTFRF
ncbi:MAG: TonB-dependent receptor [Planctomycetota bacterium]|nr:MAG: TonB-dependent receptor [Planctomycetota bacterium]